MLTKGRFVRICLLGLCVVRTHALTLLVEDKRPYAYQDGTQITGALVELARQRLEREKIPVTFNVLPSRRALAAINDTPDTCALGVPYNGALAETVTFVQPLAPIFMVVLSRKEDHLALHQIEDLRSHRTAVGEVPEIIRLLKRNALPHTVLPAGKAATEMLSAGRFDALIADYGTLPAAVTAERFEIGFLFEPTDMWLACSRGLPQTMQQQLKGIFAEHLLGEQSKDIWARFGLDAYRSRANEQWAAAHQSGRTPTGKSKH
ncbi:ABC transporter substrate-binding protein [Burkholderiaceae bacterium DAT-1]|nr:ABC transporter substrate-binding protein [Burkholderiaceae bacterium DAT-1]